MDRFKFRVWDVEEKYYYSHPHTALISDNGDLMFFEGFENGKYLVVKPDNKKYIIEWSTGLKDCNGKLIFESDTFEKGGNVFSIEWYDGGFIIQGKDDFEVFNESSVGYYDIAITGNIHEVDNAKAN